MASGAVGSKAEVLLLLNEPILLLPLCCWGVWSLFCCVVPNIISSFAIISLEKRPGCFTFIALCCDFYIMCLFLMMQLVGVQCVILAFPGHTYLLLYLVLVIQENPPQFENQIMAWVYIRSITRSTNLYQKAPFFSRNWLMEHVGSALFKSIILII